MPTEQRCEEQLLSEMSELANRTKKKQCHFLSIFSCMSLHDRKQRREIINAEKAAG